MASCPPPRNRRRVVQRSADAEAAVRRFHELGRASAAESERRLREVRRAKLVEGALVTVQVARDPNASRTGDVTGADGASARSCCGQTIDPDSAVPTSRGRSEGALRPKGGMDGTDRPGGEGKGARRERPIDLVIGSGSCDNPSAASEAAAARTPRPAEGAAESLTAEHSIASQDWQVETCAICLEPYGENDRVSYSRHRNCAHAFHTPCILAWLKDEFRNDCPCCRRSYLHLCVVEDDGDYL